MPHSQESGSIRTEQGRTPEKEKQGVAQGRRGVEGSPRRETISVDLSEDSGGASRPTVGLVVTVAGATGVAAKVGEEASMPQDAAPPPQVVGRYLLPIL